MNRVYHYPVSEIFGPVCQGEGQLIGRPTVFVRLGGCDYRCSWCDSLYAVLPEHRNDWTKMTVTQIVNRVRNLIPGGQTVGVKTGHVTLSGGNPAIHPLRDLIDGLHDLGVRVGIETQGTVLDDGSWIPLLDDVTLSPKPPSSGNVTRYDDGSTLAGWITRASHAANLCLKVVAFDDDDYAYARDVHRTWPNIPFYLQAGTLVNVASRDDLCASLSDWQDRVCQDPDMQDIAVLPQLHAILKGHARGI